MQAFKTLKKIFRKSSNVFALSLLSLAILVAYTNCGEIGLLPLTEQAPIGSIISNEAAPTVFKIPPVKDYEMRVAFFVDVSASMQSRSCIGRAADEDVGNCQSGRVGSDPLFYRLQMIETWIKQMDDFLASKNLPQSKLKMIFIPFSGGVELIQTQNPVRYANLIDLYLSQKTFTSDRQAIQRVINTYRKMHYAFSEIPPDVSLLEDDFGLSVTMENYAAWSGAANAYIKTSIPAPNIDVMLTSINNELSAIQAANPDLLSQTRFEVAFLSDGISKPHEGDMKNAIRLFWENKKIYRDYKSGYAYLRSQHGMCGESPYPDLYCEFQTVDFSPGGENCPTRCEANIQELLMRGQRLTNESDLCRRCIESVLDYLATPAGSSGGPRETVSFIDAAKQQWGEFQLNYNWRIQRSIKSIETKFLEFPQVEFRFNFIRFESAEANLKPPASLLTKERNWLVQSALKFADQHRHVVSTTSMPPFSLFPGLTEINGYKLSQFFVINPQARINSIGIVVLDSDADGLFDHEEDQLGNYNKVKSRTNDICLDVIDYRFGGCIILGCDPEIDLDGDGLNQCEENSTSTMDTDFDTDNDGISDYMEVVYGFNPTINDRNADDNGDGTSNYINFTHGAGPWTILANVPEQNKIKISIRETDPVATQLADGTPAFVPAYAIQLLSIPSLNGLAAMGGIKTYYNVSKTAEFENTPPILSGNYARATSRLLLMGRIDHTQNYGDVFWIFQPIEVQYSPETIRINVDLQQMQPMPWRDGVGGSQ
jgi:hypothetical protein